MTENPSPCEHSLKIEEKPKRIALLAFNDAEILDITGPLDVFAMTDRLMRLSGRTTKPIYTVEILSDQPGPITTMGGFRILADRAYTSVGDDIDTLFVSGGIDAVKVMLHHKAMLNWLSFMEARVRRLGSICTGAFLFAKCGLLDGRRATTHWAYCEQLVKEYPQIKVEPDQIYVRDGSIYTSAGITAGIDLALAMVEEDLGREVAMLVARQFVMFLKRPGGQSQFSLYLTTEASNHESISQLQAWIIENPTEDLHVDKLAERMAMSSRNFARIFTKETGKTPARFVEAARIDTARRFLEDTLLSVETIADKSGFGDSETMRRAFIRQLSVNPQSYRTRFSRFDRQQPSQVDTNAPITSIP